MNKTYTLMLEVSKVSNTVLYYEQRIKGYVCQRCQRCQILYCAMNKGSNVMYVKGVKSSSIYTIRAVILCMSKVLKEVQNGLIHLWS